MENFIRISVKRSEPDIQAVIGLLTHPGSCAHRWGSSQPAAETVRAATAIIFMLAAGSDGRCRSSERERKVRTPQSSVPDNVRESLGAPPLSRSLRQGGESLHSTESATENIPPRRRCGSGSIGIRTTAR